MERVFAIDPGVAGTGWVHLQRRRRDIRIVDAGNIYANQHLEWFEKASTITRVVIEKLRASQCDRVVCEFPTYMAGNVASSRSDATVKMAYLVGQIAGAIDPMEITLVLPGQWKGTMKKALVERRIRKQISIDPSVKSHALDAIGIGLWYLKGEI